MKLLWRKLWDRLVEFLKQGMSPEKMALTCALGVVVGILPIWGVTTFICLLIAPVFRINIVMLQLVHYFVYPLQLLLIIPFIKVGTFLFGVNPMPYALTELISRFKIDFWGELKQVGFAIALGVGVWAVVSVPLGMGIYFISHHFFVKWRKANQRELKSQ
ncbi:MAG: DUF2062 domain-containing protein [Cyclobacteriaceae bacterium]|nr:DUF2062 domain-containing protein [Cyclobacteriaceae bacterium]